ncbi:hypothetical protein BSKO_06525 [Bryopsis sp. KO-2023]|nr:hypothetical protein BSKO_06525 [Bryopsis sp. KO-2023]
MGKGFKGVGLKKKRKRNVNAEGGGDPPFPVGVEKPVPEQQGIFLHQADVGWTPTAIVALAATEDGCFVAAARESGAIEVYETSDEFPTFSLAKVIPGRKGAAISSLLWAKGGKGRWRLLSGGLDGFIVEWDLQTLDVKTSETAHGGAVWGMAMKTSKDGEQLLAAACDDGSVRVFVVEEDGGILLKGSMMSDSERCLCVSWETKGTRLVSGHSDGCIRVWETDGTTRGSAGHEVQKITLLRAVKKRHLAPGEGRKKPFKESTAAERFGSVWCLLFLSDGTIVSGDSNGRVLFWDALYGNLLFEFHKHEADVTALMATHDEKGVMASGVDVRIAVFQHLLPRDGVGKWVYSHAKRPHTHDVRALLAFRRKEVEYLMSGGQDTRLLWLAATKQNAAQQFLLGRMQCAVKAPEACKYQVVELGEGGNRVLISSGHRTVDFFGLHGDPNESDRDKPDGEELATHENIRHLARVEMEDECHLVCSRLSWDGKFLVTSTLKQLKVMEVAGLSESVNSADANVWGSSESRLSVKPVKIVGAKPAVCLTFSSDSRLMYAADTNNSVTIVNLMTRKIEGVVHLKEPRRSEGGNGPELSPIRNGISGMVVSNGERWVACVAHNRVHVYDVKEQEFHATFTLAGQVACATFAGASSLVVVQVNKRVTAYHVPSMSITQWSKENPVKLDATFGRVLGVEFIPRNECQMVLYTEESCSNVTFSRPLQNHKAMEKRQRWNSVADEPGMNPRVVHFPGSSSVLHAEFMGNGALMMVRGDWKRVLDTLPPPIYRVRYGLS